MISLTHGRHPRDGHNRFGLQRAILLWGADSTPNGCGREDVPGPAGQESPVNTAAVTLELTKSKRSLKSDVPFCKRNQAAAHNPMERVKKLKDFSFVRLTYRAFALGSFKALNGFVVTSMHLNPLKKRFIIIDTRTKIHT